MTITFNIFNSIDSIGIMKITMPWEYKKAAKGFYSELWKHFKISVASTSKLDKRFVRAEIKLNRQVIDRFEINLPSGLKFNCPFDLNVTDFKIINLHLEALKLSCEN